MTYHVGQRVKVRSDLVVGGWYGSDTLVSEMMPFVGTVAVINNVFDSGYTLIGNGDWIWTDEMFEDIVDDIEFTNENILRNAVIDMDTAVLDLRNTFEQAIVDSYANIECSTLNEPTDWGTWNDFVGSMSSWAIPSYNKIPKPIKHKYNKGDKVRLKAKIPRYSVFYPSRGKIVTIDDVNNIVSGTPMYDILEDTTVRLNENLIKCKVGVNKNV